MKKCMQCGGAMKKMQKGGQTIVGMPGYNATTRPMQMKSGGDLTAVKNGCPPGTARLANGGCGERPLYGG
jgi:hypothetical protein